MNTQELSSTIARPLFVRRRWTLPELEQMVAAGIVADSERVELIDGDVILQSTRSRRHEIVRSALLNRWARKLPDNLMIASPTTLALDPYVAPEPDILFYPASILAPDVRGDTVLLVIEIADSSYSYDLKIKGPLYASFGVREYWVIEPKTLVTTVHRNPGAEGYAEVREVAGTEIIAPLAVPGLGVRLADLIG